MSDNELQKAYDLLPELNESIKQLSEEVDADFKGMHERFDRIDIRNNEVMELLNNIDSKLTK